MKLIKSYFSNAHGQPKLFEFHISVEELKLLLGLLNNYELHGVKGKDWKPDIQRSRTMIKGIKKALADNQ